ncbi:hypothetical protein CWI36_0591p0010 [Hamiltosporidium magnivora]|uniref:Uncharacterized protein n=1 Tax=Hamiltosporidium magnivora TaxID=148818 RepID=A0A4Q9LCX1_9MICR|nr:hypothetical protein CWI36_0591p0010 [Hamiltosporidium magnivora]
MSKFEKIDPIYLFLMRRNSLTHSKVGISFQSLLLRVKPIELGILTDILANDLALFMNYGAKRCYFRSQDVGGTNNPLEQMGNEKYGVKILVQKVCTHRVSVRNYSGK